MGIRRFKILNFAPKRVSNESILSTDSKNVVGFKIDQYVLIFFEI